jgi:hypothetical protein
MIRATLMAAVLAALAAAPLGAQARVPAVGDRVRITSPAGGRLKGELVAVRRDTLFVRLDPAAGATAVPLSQVDRIEVRRQRTGMEGLGVGLLYGVPIGLGSGYLLGRLAEGSHDRCGDDCGLMTGLGALGGLVAGTVLGTVFGIAMPGGRWEPARRTAAAPTGGGVALSIAIRL